MIAVHFARFVSFVCFVSFVDTAAAQEPLRLTLEEAQTRAQAASHRVAELEARGAAASAAADVRAAEDRPKVAFMGGYTRTNHVEEFSVPGGLGRPPRVIYPDIPDNWRTRIDLQWPIYTGGRTDALERAARAEASAVEADVAAARADLRLEVTRTFWALVTARASVEVLERALARAEVHADDVRARLAAGIVPPNDVATADTQVQRQRLLLIEAQNQRDTLEAGLARLVGENLLRDIEPVATLDDTPPGGETPPPGDLDALVAHARSARDERRGLERRAEAAEELGAAAASGLRPTLAVVGGIDYARPNPRIFPRSERWEDSWDAGVNVTWPLWDGGRTAATTAEARAAADAARRRLAEFDSQLSLEIRQRQLELSSAGAAVVVARYALLSATEASRVVAERYAVGVVTNTDVLDAQLALLQAELDETRALANVRLAEARLARAVGQ